MKRLPKRTLPGPALAFGANAAMAGCGKVRIANMNWASAQLMAEVNKIILAEGYGCDVELVPGDTMPTFTSLNGKSGPGVAPELWINAVRDPLEIAMDERRSTRTTRHRQTLQRPMPEAVYSEIYLSSR